MYNTEIAEHLFKKYGDEKFIIYCQMESDKNNLIDEDLKKRKINEPNDHGFDSEWWDKQYQKLLNY